MDITETYIKMCDCPEIQEQRLLDIPYKDGDWWMSKRWADAVPCAWRGYRELEEIWLPRQDQLQAMISPETYERDISWNEVLIHLMSMWVEKKRQYTNLFTSMEQLWLGFYMKEKYNKTWTGEKWEDAL